MLCWLLGCRPVARASVTTFLNWADGLRYTTDNAWTECRRCGKRLTMGTIVVRPGPGVPWA